MKAENRHDIAEKKIVSDPIPVEWDFISKYMRGSALKRLDDERMVMSQTYIGWIELGLVIFTSYLYMYMMSGVNERVEEQFKLDYETATQEQFYSLKSYKDSLGMTDLKLVERNPNKDELEIITRYRELGEEGYRKYLKKKERNKSGYYGVVGQIVLLSIPIVLLLMGFPRRKRFIFDRKNGTIQYPSFWVFGSCKQSFSDVNFIYTRAGMYATESESLAILHPNGVSRVFIDMECPEKFLSFYVWYMDKNRPLPPGTAFDFYRERDYERRKAEGFPPPMYPSDIDTPEWEGAESAEKREEFHKKLEAIKERAKMRKELFI